MDLHTKYRPKVFSGVVGHRAVIRSLYALQKKGFPHAWLLTGPSGVGKTTIARIICNELDCHSNELLEIDAATHTGVDAWREITSTLLFQPLQGAVKCVVVDECHMLSKSAWNSLLKVVEEPPDHVYWFFCTTEEKRVPRTIQTRCHDVKLKLLKPDDLFTIMRSVSRIPDDILWQVVEYAEGSARQALTGLAAVLGVESEMEAKELLQRLEDSSEVIELCRALATGALSWSGAMKIFKRMDQPDPESMRKVICAYFTKVAVGAKSEEQAISALAVLDAFREPYYSTSGLGPFLVSLGTLLVNSNDV